MAIEDFRYKEEALTLVKRRRSQRRVARTKEGFEAWVTDEESLDIRLLVCLTTAFLIEVRVGVGVAVGGRGWGWLQDWASGLGCGVGVRDRDRAGKSDEAQSQPSNPTLGSGHVWCSAQRVGLDAASSVAGRHV